MVEKRKPLSPCVICIKKISDEDDVIFCPNCGEAYHLKCWNDVGKGCKVKGCHGTSKKYFTGIEAALYKSLGLAGSELLSECKNCEKKISLIERYCTICGEDNNPPKSQQTSRFYSIAHYFHRNRLRIYIVVTLLILGFQFVLVGSSVARGFNYVSSQYEDLTTMQANALMNENNTATAAVLSTNTPNPTLTFTIRPTRRPTSTNTKLPTNTQKATITLTPRSTPTVTPEIIYSIEGVNAGYAQYLLERNEIPNFKVSGFPLRTRATTQQTRDLGRIESWLIELTSNSGQPEAIHCTVTIYESSEDAMKIIGSSSDDEIRVNFSVGDEMIVESKVSDHYSLNLTFRTKNIVVALKGKVFSRTFVSTSTERAIIEVIEEAAFIVEDKLADLPTVEQ